MESKKQMVILLFSLVYQELEKLRLFQLMNNRGLIGDDEHGWSCRNGVFFLTFLKGWNDFLLQKKKTQSSLTEEKDREIYKAIKFWRH